MAIYQLPLILSRTLMRYNFSHISDIENDIDTYIKAYEDTIIKLTVDFYGINLYIDDTIEIEHAHLNSDNARLICTTIKDKLFQLGLSNRDD